MRSGCARKAWPVWSLKPVGHSPTSPQLTTRRTMTTESDRLLVQRIRANDQKAWQEIDRRYRGRLTAYVRRRLKDHASVEDVVQETFIGFANSLVNYDDRRDLQTWLFTIAAHKVTDQLRRMGRRPATAGGEDEEMLGQAHDERQRPASSLARTRSAARRKRRRWGCRCANWSASSRRRASTRSSWRWN